MLERRVSEAIAYLRRLLAIIDRDGGYRTAEDQATIRGARALLRELGETKPNGQSRK